MTMRAKLSIFLAAFALSILDAQAGPYIPAGDIALRHDIQRLADVGLIKGPVTTWPLAWGPILSDLRNADASKLRPGAAAALRRVRQRGDWETRSDQITFNASAAGAVEPSRIRGFQNTPRGEIALSAGAGYTGEWLSTEINVQSVDSDQDSDEARFDNSLVGAVVGNWSIAASTQQRWWGPGWDGSLILSNNARPMPALIVDRVFTDPWQTKWLSWLGPWDFSMMFGQMEKEREVPDARFFGMRVTIRPFDSLELGLSRMAQWCGDGRSCNARTFVDLFLGNDNRGGGGIDPSNEPGNQLAGLDFRWTPGSVRRSISFYGQFVGEDEAGGFPSRWLGLVGGEWSGYWGHSWSTHVFAELAATSCKFYASSEIANCAYNHDIYRTGYRFRGRTVGHGADNDARIVSFGLSMVNNDDTFWRAVIRHGALNRIGAPDARNSLTPTQQDISSADLTHSRAFGFGVVELGIGLEKVEALASGQSSSDSRYYLQWRSSY